MHALSSRKPRSLKLGLYCCPMAARVVLQSMPYNTGHNDSVQGVKLVTTSGVCTTCDLRTDSIGIKGQFVHILSKSNHVVRLALP